MMTLITIVTIVRNDRQGLAVTRASIECQQFKDFEWLIIDGASTDGTAEDALAISSAYARAISAPDKGIYDAMNKGLNLATGKFILFLNAGDIFPENSTLSLVAPFLDKENISFVYGDSFEKYSGNSYKYKPARQKESISYGMFGCHQAMYYARKVIGDMRYNTEFNIAGDYDFTARFLNKTGQVVKISKPLCVFDLKGASNKNRNKGRYENWIVQKNTLKLPLGKRLFNQLAYRFSTFISLKMPGVYKIMRYRANKN